MTIHRFFVPFKSIRQNLVVMPEEISKQITKVLRLRQGDKIIVLDNRGMEYEVILNQMISKEVAGDIVSRQMSTSEPKLKITLYQALLPREKFELVLQKGTEVGIDQFVPIETKRSLINKNQYQGKQDRWRRILQEAAEQSERTILPALKDAISFDQAIEEASKEGLSLVAAERDPRESLRDVLKSQNNLERVSIFIGPEGGFELQEFELAKKMGAKLISLGPRIFKAETAGLVLSSLLLFLNNDLD